MNNGDMFYTKFKEWNHDIEEKAFTPYQSFFKCWFCNMATLLMEVKL